LNQQSVLVTIDNVEGIVAVNCAVDCVNGCILGDQCPNLEHVNAAAKFISDTSLDKMLEIAEEAQRKKAMARVMEPPQWVFPDQD
jgi:hypothetical protein